MNLLTLVYGTLAVVAFLAAMVFMGVFVGQKRESAVFKYKAEKEHDEVAASILPYSERLELANIIMSGFSLFVSVLACLIVVRG